MSHTDHSRYQRHKPKNPKRERRERQILATAVARNDFDGLPSRIATRELRTY